MYMVYTSKLMLFRVRENKIINKYMYMICTSKLMLLGVRENKIINKQEIGIFVLLIYHILGKLFNFVKDITRHFS